MARDFAKPFYDSAAWQRCRASYIKQRIAIDGGLCEVCHEQLGYIVHHKIWLTEENINDPEITLNHSNLRYECLDCHNLEEEPDGSRIRYARYAFDSEGNTVSLLPP
ncbi:MAG: hypothetical protein LUC89_05790 [Oscillospiraceae bacterium]|nr:hypothetical protein [Oscillospiraceae bacterium]